MTVITPPQDALGGIAMEHGDVTAAPASPPPTTPPPTGLDGIPDFTPDRGKVRFRIGEDVFQGVADIPALAALRFAATAEEFDESLTSGDTTVANRALAGLFGLLLVPESAERMLARMDDPVAPIGLETFNNVLPWLMEQYGMRPTPLSASLPPGPDNPAAGPSSTDTISATGSTSSPSDSIAS